MRTESRQVRRAILRRINFERASGFKQPELPRRERRKLARAFACKAWKEESK